MAQRIVIEFPDGAPYRLFADVVAAVSPVVQAIANASSPPIRVFVHHDLQEPRGRPSLAPPSFVVVLRGYDRAQVDQWVRRAQQSAPPYPAPSFDTAMRGYNRAQVDAWVRLATHGS